VEEIEGHVRSETNDPSLAFQLLHDNTTILI